MIIQQTMRSSIILKIDEGNTPATFKKQCKAVLAAEKAINSIKLIKVDGMTVHVRAHIGGQK